MYDIRPDRVGWIVYDAETGRPAVLDDVALVEDQAIRHAQALLWRDWRMATEPGGAAALAALVSGAYKARPGERIGVLLCGANVDLTKLAEIGSHE